MSEEDKILALGRNVHEYSKVRSDLAALLSEADRHCQTLQGIVWFLRPPDKHSTSGLQAGTPIELGEYPSPERLKVLIAEIQAAIARKKQLAAMLKEMGAEQKD